MATPAVDVKKTLAPRPPTDSWQGFRSEMDGLFDRLSGFGLPSMRRMLELAPAETSFSFYAPAVDVIEDDKAYKISAEPPRLEEKDIDVSVTGDVLTLMGEKHQEKEEKNKNYHSCERSYGSFQRAFALPEGVDRDKIAAEFTKDVLTLTLPMSAAVAEEDRSQGGRDLTVWF